MSKNVKKIWKICWLFVGNVLNYSTVDLRKSTVKKSENTAHKESYFFDKKTIKIF